MARSVFYVSDSTAITAKGLGSSLLSQFEHMDFIQHLRPYIDSIEKILALAEEIKKVSEQEQQAPIIFVSIMDENLKVELNARISGVIDIFAPFLPDLERKLEKKSSKQVGQAHKAGDQSSYKKRIEAIDFTLATDDGLRVRDYDQADLILLGVSRAGKTPTALYLALNFGLKVANYPFTFEDLPRFELNDAHKKNREKLVGLCISEERLAEIRRERRSGGAYAAPENIKAETKALMSLYRRENIFTIDTTTRSVEEIAASVVSRVFRKK